MPLHIGWYDITLRMGLAFLAGLLVGLNRGRRGEVAGLRTTMLVCLAAAGFVEKLSRDSTLRELKWIPDAISQASAAEPTPP
jgi:uncharacterized membrane protein YhiD involved in acid resistance